MSRKEQIERQFKEAQRQYAAGELPLPDEDDPTEHWPLHKFAVFLYNAIDGGAELVEVFLERAELRHEPIADAAVESERRHFPHVAEVLWRVAENAKSEVDDIIERKIAPYHRDPEARREWLIGQWLRTRMAVTGQSWNELVHFYDLQDWLGIGSKEATNGAGTRH